MRLEPGWLKEAGTHASTQKRVGLEFDHAIAAPVVMPAHLPAYKKDGPRRHRSLIVELEHVSLHLLEPRPLPWRHGVEIHLHDLHPGHHEEKFKVQYAALKLHGGKKAVEDVGEGEPARPWVNFSSSLMTR